MTLQQSHYCDSCLTNSRICYVSITVLITGHEGYAKIRENRLVGPKDEMFRHIITPKHPHIHLLTYSPTHPLTHSLTHSPTHWPIHPLTHPPTHSLVHSLTRPLTNPLTHAITHSHPHSPTHPITLSHTHSPNHAHTRPTHTNTEYAVFKESCRIYIRVNIGQTFSSM
jgi:hypothetical protein